MASRTLDGTNLNGGYNNLNLPLIAIIRKRIFLNVCRLSLADLAELEAEVVDVAAG